MFSELILLFPKQLEYLEIGQNEAKWQKKLDVKFLYCVRKRYTWKGFSLDLRKKTHIHTHSSYLDEIEQALIYTSHFHSLLSPLHCSRLPSPTIRACKGTPLVPLHIFVHFLLNPAAVNATWLLFFCWWGQFHVPHLLSRPHKEEVSHSWPVNYSNKRTIKGGHF